jgi:phage terminase large subunit-like protein
VQTTDGAHFERALFCGRQASVSHRSIPPRLEYPALKRAVREQQNLLNASVVLIEDKASGTQLIQDLIAEGCHGVTRYQPTDEKTMRMRSDRFNRAVPRMG